MKEISIPQNYVDGYRIFFVSQRGRCRLHRTRRLSSRLYCRLMQTSVTLVPQNSASAINNMNGLALLLDRLRARRCKFQHGGHWCQGM